MGKKAPWSDIPDTSLVPTDIYDYTVKSMEEQMSREYEDSKPKLMYVVGLKLDEPKSYRGQVVTMRYTIGTDTDPEADDPETWRGSYGAKGLKQLVASLGIDTKRHGDMDDTCEEAVGLKASALIELRPRRTDPKTGRTYQESNQITPGHYYKLGERPPGAKEAVQGAAAPTPTARPAAPRAAKATPANGEDKEVKPKKVAKSEVTTCPICGADDVPRADFLVHVKVHEQEPATE